MVTVTVVNRKGGSSKTSTCFHLSGALARNGKRVLVCDLDPQASLTQGFLGVRAAEQLDPRLTIASVWTGEPLPEQVIRPSGIPGISLLPGHEDATEANMIPRSEWGDRVMAIRNLLAEVTEEYDHVLLDCPPNLCYIANAALAAADEVIVPVQPESFASGGLVAIGNLVRRGLFGGRRPRILGYLLSMVDQRLSIHREYEDNLRDIYGDLVFRTRIPYSKHFKESVPAQMPVSHHCPRSAAAKAFAELADEIESRLEKRDVTPEAA